MSADATCDGCGAAGPLREVTDNASSRVVRVCGNSLITCLHQALAHHVPEAERGSPVEPLLGVAYATEAPFQEDVIALAKYHGWLAYHTHDSRKSEGGFPDLVLVRDHILYRELKRSLKEKPSRAQQKWIDALAAAGGDAKVWTPEDRDEIYATLQKGEER